MAHIPYSNVVRCLMYTILFTHLDISFAVRLLSWLQSSPDSSQWNVVKRVLRYLRGTIDYELCFAGSDLRLHGYRDADYVGDLDERKLTSAYSFLFGGDTMFWRSKKQWIVALLTMKAEFVAALSAAQEAIWLSRFMWGLEVISHSSNPITLYTDSMAAIGHKKNARYHAKTKHKDV